MGKSLFVQRTYGLRNAIRGIVGYRFLSNVNQVQESLYSKRALLVYMTKPFQLEEDDPLFLGHQNLKQSRQIAMVLNDLGYVVDVAHYRDRRFKARAIYDLVISHKVTTEGLTPALGKGARIVYLATGMNHAIHNRNMRARFDELRKRRQCKMALPRPNQESMPFVSMANAIIGLGNQHTAGSWAQATDAVIYFLNNYGFASTRAEIESKKYESARKGFVFFASGPQLNKGLDLLLEVFPKHPALQLYVCSGFRIERDFCSCYRKELFETPNIHPIGWVQVNSDEFYSVMTKSAFIIHPTCSEGQPGSVVQCMSAGLIPLVTKECGIDTEDFGVTIGGSGLDEIEAIIQEMSEKSAEMLKSISKRVVAVCAMRFDEQHFVERWREIVHAIEMQEIPEAVHPSIRVNNP